MDKNPEWMNNYPPKDSPWTEDQNTYKLKFVLITDAKTGRRVAKAIGHQWNLENASVRPYTSPSAVTGPDLFADYWHIK